jgi:hypothetical protein
MNTLARTALNLDPRIIFDLAAQIDPPDVVAQEHGMDLGVLLALMENEQVKRAIADKRKELKETGFTLAAKAKLCFEDLLSDVYKKAKAPDVSLSATLNAADFFRKVAGLDRQDLSTQQEKFSISINLTGVTGTATVAFNPLAPNTQKKAAAFTVEDAQESLPSDLPEFITPALADSNVELEYVEA